LRVDKDRIYGERLALRCRRGDRDAFEELVHTWEKRLFYYVRRLVDHEEDAWDILQQTWVHALGGIGSLKEPGDLPAWLYGIARNTAMRHWRKEYRDRRRREEPNDEIPCGETMSQEVRFENAEQVHHALGSLSRAHREVLTLFFLADLSTEEMARVLDVPPGTVRSRLFYAKRALRDHLEREDATDA